MTVPFEKIWNELSPERQERIEAKFQEYLIEYQTLQTLRKDLNLSQEEVAETLNIHQVNVSKLEKRADLKVSTLRDYLAALGGQLQLSVTFPGKPPIQLALGQPGDNEVPSLKPKQA